MRQIVSLLATLVLLSACASAQKLDAANDVHALLTSIRNDDSAAFDAHVDRPALEREIEGRLATRAAKDRSGLGALGVLLAPALSQIASDALIQPYVFRSVAEYYGYNPQSPLPGRLAIASTLKPLDDGRICATRKKDGPCLLLFTQLDGTWKLSGFEGDLRELRLKK